MVKPNTLKDLVSEGHVSLSEVRQIAKDIFDGQTTAAGPEGYIITAADFNELGKHVQDFIVKAILDFRVNNILDLDLDVEDDVEDSDDSKRVLDDGED